VIKLSRGELCPGEGWTVLLQHRLGGKDLEIVYIKMTIKAVRINNIIVEHIFPTFPCGGTSIKLALITGLTYFCSSESHDLADCG
jgi:hypothetical protein